MKLEATVQSIAVRSVSGAWSSSFLCFVLYRWSLPENINAYHLSNEANDKKMALFSEVPMRMFKYCR
ncbi:hypothetical protein MPTK1_2g19340 [Marchantia polymorpha subsp. ruderalis]|uniref:Uncharacterized protein n=1 Tax=Marchantia polymorpha TaxID=3197 RepID=A0A2R6WVJ2_MARPO|nr:hypothetical protein MARPO_0055s0118 [Marchantia polymorpha]BBN02923.1 hypothetical protein Mp_2g19340 [Marchantia polymorpha subsp. ruderalis]|eukprot:PTQ37869.1 hypothetical protein MARPO_0055s0118 [Marchantia polymorpha]